MKKRIIMSVMALLLLLAMAAGASAVTVTRNLPDDPVDEGAEFQVSISQTGFFVVGTVTEELPTGYAYVAGSAAGVDSATYDAGTRTLELVIDSGTSTVTYNVIAGSDDGTFTGTYATIDADINQVIGDVTGEDTVTIAGIGGTDAVTVTRNLPDDPVDEGAEFQVSISQSGFLFVGTVTEVLPTGYAYVAGSAAGVDSATYDAGTRTLELVIDSGTPTVTYDVTAGSDDGTFIGTYATIDSDTNPVTGDVTGEDTVTIVGVVPEEVAAVTRDLPDGTVNPGAEFQVSISQSGFLFVGTVDEVLPSGYAYVDGSAAGVDSATYDAGTRTLELVIDSETPTVTYNVTAGTDNGTFTGTFTTIDENTDRVDGDVTGDDTVTIFEGPEPNITNPTDGAPIMGTVSVTAINTNDRIIVECVFEYSQDTTWTEIGTDADGTDGWGVDLNTKVIPDGDLTIRATMRDSEDENGSAQITVTLANPPEPRITSPLEGAKIKRGTTINIVEVDDSGQDDIVSNTFEYSADGTTWTLIGTDVSPDGGWKIPWNIPEDLEKGDYKIRATMEDVEGNTGTDEINISILSEGIPLYEGWNLFSVPGILNNSDVEHVLDTIIPDPAAALIYWDANADQWVNVAEIEPLKAYAVFISEPATIVNLDLKPEPSGSLQLYAGDNLIGMTGYSSASAEVALSIGLGDIDNSYDKIFRWDTEKTVDLIGYNCNKFPGPSCPPVFDTGGVHVTTEDFPMAPYEGYWIHMVEEDVYEGQTI